MCHPNIQSATALPDIDDHFTLLALRVQGNKVLFMKRVRIYSVDICLVQVK